MTSNRIVNFLQGHLAHKKLPTSPKEPHKALGMSLLWLHSVPVGRTVQGGRSSTAWSSETPPEAGLVLAKRGPEREKRWGLAGDAMR